MDSKSIAQPQMRFAETFCSQCGGKFGPGNNGFSHCADHQSPGVRKAMDVFEAALIARRVSEALSLENLQAMILEVRREPGVWRAEVQAKLLAAKISAAIAKAEGR